MKVRRSQLRDHGYYRENQAAIEQAARRGELDVVDDLPKTGWQRMPPPTPVIPKPPATRGGSEIRASSPGLGSTSGGGGFWASQADALRAMWWRGF